MVRFNTDSLVMPLTPQELQILKQRRRNGEFGPHRSSAWLLVLILLIFVVAFSAIIINLLTATGPPLRDVKPHPLRSRAAILVIFESRLFCYFYHNTSLILTLIHCTKLCRNAKLLNKNNKRIVLMILFL